MPSFAALRFAPWSMSKVKCAQRCPREFAYRYVEKVAEPEVSPEQRLGKAVHLALELVLARRGLDEALAAGRQELLHDEERTRYDELAASVTSFVDRIEAFRVKRRPRLEHVEQKLAIDAQLGPTQFIAQDAFFRGVLDVGFEWGEGELAVVDHKTGMRRPASVHAEQLEGYAALSAAHMPRLRRIWMGVHYVADAAMEWSAPVPIDDVKKEFVPRLLDQIELAAKSVDGPLDPRPGPYCEWCSYRKICPAMRAINAAAAADEPAP
jgi:CRISPR/Cas system-associated exonuclease Cas4 (RecB family)